MRERRKATRYPLGVEGTVNPPQGGAGTNVIVPVISTLGCAIECANYESIGKKCELYFNWQDMQVGVQAQVAWRGAGTIGLKFNSVDEDTRRRLSALCASLAIRVSAAFPTEEAKSATPLPDPSRALRPASESAPSAARRGILERERRRVPRYISELTAHVSNPATGESSSVTLITLSVLGGCLDGRVLPEPGEKCELHAEWQGEPFVVPGEVVWKIKEEAGVKFAPLDDGLEKLLRQICATLRLQPLAPLPPRPE
jgi:PilZ domain-containing protein